MCTKVNHKQYILPNRHLATPSPVLPLTLSVILCQLAQQSPRSFVTFLLLFSFRTSLYVHLLYPFIDSFVVR